MGAGIAPVAERSERTTTPTPSPHADTLATLQPDRAVAHPSYPHKADAATVHTLSSGDRSSRI